MSKSLMKMLKSTGLSVKPGEPHRWLVTTPLMSPHSLQPFAPDPWASCSPITWCIYLAVDQTFCPKGYCERQHQKLYWNTKRLHQQAFLGQPGGYPVLEGKQVSKAGLSPHKAVLAVTDECIVLQVFFNTSQNNLFHDFTRHWSETERCVVSRVLLALLENWDSICQLPVRWDLSRFPRPLKSHWERFCNYISQLFEDS